MAADQANVRADLVKVSIGGNDYLEARVGLELGGEKIDITPARFGEAVGHIQGKRNVDIEIDLLEASPAVRRAMQGFDNDGQDAAPAVGSGGTYVPIVVQDPADTAGLGKLTFLSCGLLKVKTEEDGEGLKIPKYTFRAYRDGNGDVWKIGT